MNNYLYKLQQLQADATPCVTVSVVFLAGSAPREPGAKMIVTTDRSFGTIGGGNLEFEAVRIAREHLEDADGVAHRFVELFPLGPMLEQCCGGAVILLFEVALAGRGGWLERAISLQRRGERAVLVSRVREQSPEADPDKLVVTATGASGSFGSEDIDTQATGRAREILSGDHDPAAGFLLPLAGAKLALPDTGDVLLFELSAPADFHVVIFGAGHVGRALVTTLAGNVDCRITWIDSRAGQFPAALPDNVEKCVSADPVAGVGGLPAGCSCLIMTHSHQLDQRLCAALLQREDIVYTGLIGSATKLRRFRLRLQEEGITEQQLDRLTCPIGIPGINSKQPGAIAISVAAQLLQLYEAGHQQTATEVVDRIKTLNT